MIHSRGKSRLRIPGVNCRSEQGAVWAIVDVDLSVLSDRAKRVNITAPERLLHRIDAFAEQQGDTRSGLLVAAPRIAALLHSGLEVGPRKDQLHIFSMGLGRSSGSRSTLRQRDDVDHRF